MPRAHTRSSQMNCTMIRVNCSILLIHGPVTIAEKGPLCVVSPQYPIFNFEFREFGSSFRPRIAGTRADSPGTFP